MPQHLVRIKKPYLFFREQKFINSNFERQISRIDEFEDGAYRMRIYHEKMQLRIVQNTRVTEV